MLVFKNETYENTIKTDKNSVFICAIGYEHRSYSLFEKNQRNLDVANTMILIFDDYEKVQHTMCNVEKIKNLGFLTKTVNYNSYDLVLNEIIEFLDSKVRESKSLEIHIDYSSMPRSWYCKLPLAIHEFLRKNDVVFFWYVEGEYPDSYERFPSAGIDNFSVFSGRPSLKANNNRTHILGLGYDFIRSQAISTVIDPSFLVACYAYPSLEKDIQDIIKCVDKQILSHAALTLALHVDDFSFMFSKLCETANELILNGDVILIPDGPKPLILAMSLVADYLKIEGITCMHISRNYTHYKPIDVIPKENIYGFSFKGNRE